MNGGIRHFIVAGSSRGLGAALVDELLKDESRSVVGVSRTPLSGIDRAAGWSATGRYRHIEADLAHKASSEAIASACSDAKQRPVCVIFNAACIKNDVMKDGSINFDDLMEANSVGVDGLVHVLKGCSGRLLANGGVFVGISSFSSLVPPVYEPRVAYPASKAYLDMALRCLRQAWKGRAGVMIVHLGHLGYERQAGAVSYAGAARKIIGVLQKRRVPRELNYPLGYGLVYKYVLMWVPDGLYFFLSEFFLKIAGKRVDENAKSLRSH